MTFFQSPEWEEFQKSVGRKTWRICNVLVIRHDLPAGFNYLYCPRPDPEIMNNESGIEFLEKIKIIVRGEKSIFFKIDLLHKSQIPANYEYINSSSIQPRKTTVIDLHQSEDKLLARMHDKTRYNIRLAERKGVEVVSDKVSTQNFQKFWDLLQETSRRDKFHTHPRIYFEKLIAVRSNNFSNELFFAQYQGTILAAAIVNFYRGPTSIATYLHGASSNVHREVMAPHLLHWRIIQEARKRGFRYYDLWGIDEVRWPGLTRFKLGFSGEIVEYPPSMDIVYRQVWYSIYKLAKRLS